MNPKAEGGVSGTCAAKFGAAQLTNCKSIIKAKKRRITHLFSAFLYFFYSIGPYPVYRGAAVSGTDFRRHSEFLTS